MGYVLVGDPILVKNLFEYPVLLGDSPSSYLDLSRGLDALELAGPEALLELLDVFSFARA